MPTFQNNFYRAGVSLAGGFPPQGSSTDADEKDQGGAGAMGGVVADRAREVVAGGPPALLGGDGLGSCCLGSYCATRQVTGSMQELGQEIVKFIRSLNTCRRLLHIGDERPSSGRRWCRPRAAGAADRAKGFGRAPHYPPWPAVFHSVLFWPSRRTGSRHTSECKHQGVPERRLSVPVDWLPATTLCWWQGRGMAGTTVTLDDRLFSS
jgi:hypothetical protein